MSVRIECVVDSKNILGEVPVWDAVGQSLYWVDIEGRLLQRYSPATGAVERWEMPERISSFALREKGGLIVAFASGIGFYDLDSRAIDWIARPDTNPRNRFNEATQSYNTLRKSVPTVIVASFAGFKERPYFKATAGAEKAPSVKF